MEVKRGLHPRIKLFMQLLFFVGVSGFFVLSMLLKLVSGFDSMVISSIVLIVFLVVFRKITDSIYYNIGVTRGAKDPSQFVTIHTIMSLIFGFLAFYFIEHWNQTSILKLILLPVAIFVTALALKLAEENGFLFTRKNVTLADKMREYESTYESKVEFAELSDELPVSNRNKKDK